MSRFKKLISIIFLFLIAPLAFIHANWTTGMEKTGRFDLPNASVEGIIMNFLSWLLFMFTILAVLAFVISGVMFMFAGANDDLYKKAKNMVNYSIIGIVIGISGYIIIMFIDSILFGYIY